MIGPEYTGSNGYRYAQTTYFRDPEFVVGASRPYTGLNTALGDVPWVWNGTTTIPLCLTTPGNTGSNGFRRSTADIIRDNGLIAGHSQRYINVNTPNGQDAWVWNGTTLTQVGFIDGIHLGTNGYRSTTIVAMNSQGHAVGTSQLVTGEQTSLGQRAWVFNGTSIIPLGLDDEFHTLPDGRHESGVLALGEDGVVLGSTARLNALGQIIGRDAWQWENGTYSSLGLADALHLSPSGLRSNQATHTAITSGPSPTRIIAGTSARYAASVGQDAWVLSGGNTTQIGLNGPDYTGLNGYVNSYPDRITEDGTVFGYTDRFISPFSHPVRDAWVHKNGVTTRLLRIGEPFWYADTSTVMISKSSGIATGSTVYFGYQRAWAWYAHSLWRIGPNGNYGAIVPAFMDSAGRVVGYSDRYSNDSPPQLRGRDAWVWIPAINVQLGLTGPAYTSTNGTRFSTPILQNEAGVVVGMSNRYTGIDTVSGVDVWYFVSRTRVTIPLIGNVAYPNPPSIVSLNVLTEDGYLLGSYEPSFNSPLPDRAFIFHPDFGFADLNTLIDPGLTQSGWANLLVPTHAATIDHILGYGYVTGQTSGRSVFRLTRLENTDPCPRNPTCVADVDDGTATGTPDGAVTIDDLLYFLAKYLEGNPCPGDVDNGTGTGVRDNAVTIDDLLYYLIRMAGC
ncbi:MAG: GC-type dockerin domain-anchored protein [Phycisphaerales bacterium]